MKSFTLAKHRSWFYSGGITVLITLWLLSGTLGGDEAENTAAGPAVSEFTAQHSKVRVRTQTAEEIVRTIIVNGKTAPARIVQLSAETDGRIEYTGAERGANVVRGGTIVRLDERDRSARLAQAMATLKQREVEYEGRLKLQTKSYVSEAQLQEAIAQLEAAKTELRRAELDLEFMTVRAPFDGALQSRVVEIGEFVRRDIDRELNLVASVGVALVTPPNTGGVTSEHGSGAAQSGRAPSEIH